MKETKIIIWTVSNWAKRGMLVRNSKSCWAYLSFIAFLLTCDPILHLYVWTPTFTVCDVNFYMIPLLFPYMNTDCSDGLPWRLGFTWKRSYCCFLWGYGRFGGKHSPSSSNRRGKGMLCCEKELNLISRKWNFCLTINLYFCRQILTLWR